MKTKILIGAALISAALTSCITSYYYQVYKAAPIEQTVLQENFLIYEDENCIVYYNFWAINGNIGFKFFNKTDQNIYLNLEESFFILNGIAKNYYQNRIFTSIESTGTSISQTGTISKATTGLNYLDLIQANLIAATAIVGASTSAGYSISYNEEKIICIPSKTSKVITEYAINEYLFRDCDLFKYPTKKEIKTKSFTKSNSPLVFSNRIVYMVGQSSNSVKFENEFYVTEISNYPESEMIELGYEEFCGEKGTLQTRYFKNISPDKFYIKYEKVEDGLEH